MDFGHRDSASLKGQTGLHIQYAGNMFGLTGLHRAV